MSDAEKDMERLIDALRASAVRTQQAWQMMADDKSARNRAAGDVGASYDGGTKEQTLEWRAADTITSLRAERDAAIARAEKAEAELVKVWQHVSCAASLLGDARSNHVAGSATDICWDSNRDQWIASAINLTEGE